MENGTIMTETDKETTTILSQLQRILRRHDFETKDRRTAEHEPRFWREDSDEIRQDPKAIQL